MPCMTLRYAQVQQELNIMQILTTLWKQHNRGYDLIPGVVGVRRMCSVLSIAGM